MAFLEQPGLQVDYRRPTGGNPNKVTNGPQTTILTFSDFDDYQHHHFIAHWGGTPHPRYTCTEMGCILDKEHTDRYSDTFQWPHGNIKCKMCDLSFKLKKDQYNDQQGNCCRLQQQQLTKG